LQRLRHWTRFLIAVLVASTWSREARSGQAPIVSLTDPSGDAYGPGRYSLPLSGEYVLEDFDLRKFEVFADGADVVFEVTLGAQVRQPHGTYRTNEAEIPLWNGIYLQNIDIYLDTEPGSPKGQSAGIPGRRVAFADGRTWKRAVVLTPLPGAARDIAEDAFGRDIASHIVFVDGIQQRGRTLIARVPASELGGMPTRGWGYSVQVSGARWDRSFAIVGYLKGARELDCFTLPVLPLAEPWAFGGAPDGEVHPRVIDVLLPAEVDQKVALGSFDAKTGAFARVPFVYLEPPPPVGSVSAPALPSASTAQATTSDSDIPTTRPSAPAANVATGRGSGGPGILTITDVHESLVSMSGSVVGLKPMQFAQVLAPDGSVAAQLIINEVFERGAVATMLPGHQQVFPGWRVTPSSPR
jgi:carbohydrate-binding DOMON domain-containing protein